VERSLATLLAPSIRFTAARLHIVLPLSFHWSQQCHCNPSITVQSLSVTARPLGDDPLPERSLWLLGSRAGARGTEHVGPVAHRRRLLGMTVGGRDYPSFPSPPPSFPTPPLSCIYFLFPVPLSSPVPPIYLFPYPFPCPYPRPTP